MILTFSSTSSTELVTTTEAKLHLAISGTAQDSMLAAMISGARHKVETLTGFPLVARTATLKDSEFTGDYVELPYNIGVSSITSLKTVSEGVETTVSPSEYYLTDGKLWYTFSNTDYIVVYPITAVSASDYPLLKQLILKQLSFDYFNRGDEQGFDPDVVRMSKTITLNHGY